jgi:hypothetical protein
MILPTRHAGWRYMECHNTCWLLDSTKFDLPQPVHKGHVGSGFVVEFLTINGLTLSQLEQMAQTQQLEFRICNDDFTAKERPVQYPHVCCQGKRADREVNLLSGQRGRSNGKLLSLRHPYSYKTGRTTRGPHRSQFRCVVWEKTTTVGAQLPGLTDTLFPLRRET